MKLPLILLSFLLSLPCYAQTKLHLRGQSGNLLYTVRAGGAAPDVIPTNGLVAYFPYNGTLADMYGTNVYAGDGTGTYYTNGINNSITSALAFASGGYLAYGNSYDFSFVNNSTDTVFSVSMWLKSQNTNSEVYCSIFEAVGKGEWQFSKYYGNKVTCLLLSGGTASAYLMNISSGSFATNKWTHVCWTYNATGLNAGLLCYIDGVLTSTTTANYGTYIKMLDTTAKVRIGQREVGGYPYTGSIANWRTYKSLLISNEVNTIYTVEKATSP